MRVTFKDLTDQARQLEAISGRHFRIQAAYNRYCLVEDPPEGGGFLTHSTLKTPRELSVAIEYWRRGFEACRAKMEPQNTALLKACKAVYNDPHTTCACAEKVREAIANAEKGQGGQ